MMMLRLTALAAALLIAGCDDTAPRDVVPPAAPRGLTSVTGDGAARLSWLANTEADVAGYRIYKSTCARGPNCPYDRVGMTVGTSFAVPLSNGETWYLAVAAFDRAGNESELSREDVFDTPRPAGTGLALTSYTTAPATSGYDFSAFAVVPFDSPNADIVFGFDGTLYRMYAKYADTDIQDAGYTSSLDEVDFAPDRGWSADGTVELIEGHSYVVAVTTTHVNYAKFRVVSLSASPARAVVDWAYQIDPDNRELRQGTAPREGGRVPRAFAGLR
ncbi:MAG TPA: hypothetical protein VGK89_03330 [Candidatus Eisenbacteria bacterium]|jgi:hypothetical protein